MDAPVPEVVTLCGSTRFREAFEAEQRRLTLEGRIVLSVGMFGHEEGLDESSQVKADLDELHRRKIDLSQRIHVINVAGTSGRAQAVRSPAPERAASWSPTSSPDLPTWSRLHVGAAREEVRAARQPPSA